MTILTSGQSRRLTNFLKRGRSITFIALLLVSISACQTTSHLPSVSEISNKAETSDRYVLSDEYIDHRAQQSTIDTRAGKIAYLDYGEGPTLLMLHGVPTSSWLFRKMIASLQDDYRIIAIDLLGFGSSDKPKTKERNYHPNSQAKYVEQVLDHLEIENYNLLFHDMGGLVAWELLDRTVSGKSRISIDNMILLNTIVSKEGFNYPKQKKGFTAQLMSDAFVNELSSAAVLDMTFDNMGLTSNAKLTENECNGYVAPMKEGNGDVLYEFYTSFDNARFSTLERQVSNLSHFDGDVLVL